jgi:hypothetical protein
VDLPPILIMAIASVSCASLLMEPYDMVDRQYSKTRELPQPPLRR